MSPSLKRSQEYIITADQLATIRAKTFSQGTDGNEDEYRRILLLGLAANQLSLSGPMSNSSKIVTATSDTSGEIVDIFTPSTGECWEVQGFAINKTGLSGTLTCRLIATDGAQATTIDMSMIWISSSQDPISANEDGFHKFYVDENMTLKATAYLSGGFPASETCEFQVLLSRVRG